MQDAAPTEEVVLSVSCPGIRHDLLTDEFAVFSGTHIQQESIMDFVDVEEKIISHDVEWMAWLTEQWGKPLPAPAIFTVLADTSQPPFAVLRDCRLDWHEAATPQLATCPWPTAEESPIEEWALKTPPHPVEPFHPPPSLPFQDALRDLLDDLLKQQRRNLSSFSFDELQEYEVAFKTQTQNFHAK